MQERKFTLEDQNNFARLSGDYNKLHLDEVAARRYLFGGPVVHGIHMLLWALDNWLESFQQPVELISMKASFQRSLAINEEVKCRLNQDVRNCIKLELYGLEQVYTTVRAKWKFTDTKRVAENLSKGLPPARDCSVLTAQEVASAAGQLDLCIEKETASNLFPSLVKNMPLLQLAELLATTRLVGMECPGFHSLFFELDINFDNVPSVPSALQYKVIKFDDKFSLSVISVEGPSMKGNIKAFLRPAPCQQANFSDICKIVSGDEFKDQRALVIGGSRGLGEVTSKLLAAGGADIMLTYFRGHDDAQRVADDIISKGCKAYCVFFDVMNPTDTLIEQMIEFLPTHLYYFATPFITGTKGAFSTKLFRNFCDYYVSGFSHTLKFMLENSPALKNVFYPSSVFVEELPASLCEYSIAKSAGEVLCTFLEKTKGISIYKPRLPKMSTDQTVSLMPDTSSDPVAIMLQQLKYFKNYSR